MEVVIELPTPTLMLYIINTNVHTWAPVRVHTLGIMGIFVCSGLFPLISVAAAALLAL
jgi:hypothetical protein